ncbi:MAG TPA: hypothetical protein VMS11_01795 [Solirubrobacterales bacterium]|nr:hypothetical protein [Solirubrobacterales bacterium]
MADSENLREWRRKIFSVREHRNTILASAQDLTEWGVPDEALEAVRQYASTLVCEGCEGAATSGPHGPDGVYLCDDCASPTPLQEGS